MSTDLEARLTPVETTADGGDDHLDTKESEHGREYLAAAVVNGVYPDDMDGGADGEEDGGADGLKEVEVRTSLQAKQCDEIRYVKRRQLMR